MKPLVFPVILAMIGCAASTTVRKGLPPLTTVEKVDLGRYLGTWYEIASFPQSFQKDCFGTTAAYALEDGGLVNVVNRCRKGSLDGPEDVAIGRARVVDPSTGAKLEVSFFRPFWGDYWVIDLVEDYAYAVVGEPGRDYLWILSRTPALDDATYTGILERLRGKSYDLERLQRTAQRPTAG